MTISIRMAICTLNHDPLREVNVGSLENGGTVPNNSIWYEERLIFNSQLYVKYA